MIFGGWKVFAAVIALLLVVCAVQTVRLSAVESRLVAKDTEIAQMRQAASDAALAQAEAYREIERAKAEEAERIANEAQAQIDIAADNARSASAAFASLRGQIGRLNARVAPSDPGAAAYAHEATVARELLGACAEEYRGVAAEADGLGIQVIGLQDYVKSVVQP